MRYYEGIGLVSPATRTDAGYRVYDEHILASLAFIARAKQLGCSLEEITDLVSIWEGEQCEPVQRRFHDLVTNKIGGAQRQITELAALIAQLQAAASHLSGEPTDGRCGDDCACVTTQVVISAPALGQVKLGVKPDDPPIACTLETDALPDRLVEWQAILDLARSRTTAADGALRIEFDADLELGELARLVTAEQHCRAFFSFAITVDARGIALEVHAPGDASDIVASLFGLPA